MEITLEAIISLLGLFVGGGGGAFFTWRFLRRKAKAEAVTAEIDATKDMQDMYQQMLEDAKKDREDRREQVEELRADRDHYKSERSELRERISWAERWRRWPLLCAETFSAKIVCASFYRTTALLGQIEHRRNIT